MKSITFLLLLLVCFSCKNNEEDTSKITPTTEEQQTFDPNTEITMDDIIYAGVWRIDSTTSYADMQLSQSNNNVTGTLEYKVFDVKGEELHFKLTGAQINYPSSFTAYKL